MERTKTFDPRMPAAILDMKGLITRSYHSGVDSHPVYDPDTNERVNSAAHGAANFMERILLPILKDVAPINIIIVADGGNDLRRAVYPAYKAKRKEVKEKEESKEQQRQISLLQEQMTRLLVYLGATAVKVEQREADDVIAALVASMGDQYKTIYTVDGDLIQLVDQDLNTFLVMFDEPKNVFRHNYETVKAGKTYHEIEPKLVALYKSLIGDSSDGYPGLKGFGPGKWDDLTEVFDTESLYELDRMVATGDFTDLIAAAKANPGIKVLDLLVTGSKEWRLMYYLARLHPESLWAAAGKRFLKPIWTKRVPDRNKAYAALVALKIDDFLPDLEKWFLTRTLVTAANLEQAFGHLNDHLEDTPCCGFDYEGYDKLKHAPFVEASKRGSYVDTLSQVVTGGSLCYGSNLQHSVYLSSGHRDTANVDASYFPEIIREVQEHGAPLVIHNAGFEMTVTQMNFGEQPIHRPHNTQVMASYYDENLMGVGLDGLKDLSWEILRYRQTEYDDLLAQYDAQDMRDLTGEQTRDYGCDDSITACHLWVLFRWVLLLEGQWDFFIQKHTAPAHVMEQAFRKGVNIDWDARDRLAAADQIILDSNMARLRELLEQHCTLKDDDPDFEQRALEAVDAYMASDEAAIRHELKTKWQKKSGDERVGRERMDALWEERRLTLLDAARYVPYREVPREFEFTGTPAQLRDITGQLGFEPALDKNSGKAVKEWVTLWADANLNTQQQEFVSCLALAAGKPLKDREGPEFKDLADFSKTVMQPLMKSDQIGDELNLDSPKQVQELLYLKMRLAVRRRAKVQRGSMRYDNGFEGSPGTDKKAINAALAEDCSADDWRRDALNALREVKAAATRFELFYVPYPLWKHPLDGCVHPGVKDPGTVTRRPTAGKPNILQVSKGETREMFIPHDSDAKLEEVAPKMLEVLAKQADKGLQIIIPKLPKRLILAPDFSGQELRITGSEAQDPELIKAYTGGKRYVDKYGIERLEITDIHSLTTVKFVHRYAERELGKGVLDYLPLGSDGRLAYEWYGKVRKCKTGAELQALLVKEFGQADKLLKVLQDARGKVAKPTNFLITYLGTAPTLAENTSLPEAFCGEVMAEVFKAYARLGPWQDESIAFGRKHGYVTTAYGTRKHLSDDMLSSDRGLRSREERRACNQKIQGCAADVLHEVETDIFERDFLARYDTNFIAPVYDELVLDVPLTDDLPALITELAQMMDITPPGHAIPMMSEFSFGPNWHNQIEIGERPCEKQIEEALSQLFLKEEEKNAA